jgi:predicted lipoprotein with Yx(FWY)xxD motif
MVLFCIIFQPNYSRKSSMYFRTIASVTLLAAAFQVAAQTTPAKAADGVLTGPNGMTLYTFDPDPVNSGKSVCNGGCATNWPPLMAEAGAKTAGDFTVITRDDGKAQWAFKGKPLYYWAKDQKPGDKTGDGVNNVWKVAKP